MPKKCNKIISFIFFSFPTMCRYVILGMFDCYLSYSLLQGQQFWEEKEKRGKEQSPLGN